MTRHRCRDCGLVHNPEDTQRDRAVSGLLVGAFLAWVVMSLGGCAVRDDAAERGMGRVTNVAAIEAEDCASWP